MKQTKTILLTAFTVLMAFTGIVYTSCHKDPCKGEPKWARGHRDYQVSPCEGVAK